MKNLILLQCLIPLLFFGVAGYGQTATFLSNFEDQNTEAEIGQEHIELYDGDNMYVVANPYPDARNNSNYVLKLCAHQSSRSRAEYDAWRMETNEKTYFYAWKRYHPVGMFKDIDIGWGALNQWKTWPCEVYGSGDYEKYGSLVSYGDVGGIFNETRLRDTTGCFYLSRAEPCRKADYYEIEEGYWNDFVLEIYWTNTENGYYRLWKNDALIAYSDNMKTLFDEFLEGTCDMYWSTGLYVSWTKTGGETQDTLVAYIDDIAIYDSDEGFNIDDICPGCESAPTTPTGINVYKINLYGIFSSDGYNNYVLRYNRDPYMYNLSNTFGQSSDIDIFIQNIEGNETTGFSDECFPGDVINSFLAWYDAETHSIELKGLNPDNTYTVKALSATTRSDQGIQIWTTEANRDTVLSYGNTCAMAELTGLVSDENGDLTINVSATNAGYPRPYLNAIEIVEYVGGSTYVDPVGGKNTGNELFPNPVKDILFVKGETIPRSVTIYNSDGRIMSFAENTNSINVSHLGKGVYIVLIKMQESIIARKIVKE